MTVGEKIKLKRKGKGFTQKKLGELTGIHETTIKHYELGLRNPKIITLKKLAIALNASVDYFLDIERNEETIFEKVTSINIKEIKIYSDACNMTIPEFMGMVIKQGVESTMAGIFSREPELKHKIYAELQALDDAKKKGESITDIGKKSAEMLEADQWDIVEIPDTSQEAF